MSNGVVWVPSIALSAEDVDALSDVLARAFLHDPLQAWLFPDAKKRPSRLRRFFALDIRHRLSPSSQVALAPDRSGVAFWHPPGAWRSSTRALRVAPAFLSLIGKRAWRAYRGLRAVEAAHPSEHHWYLSHLAIEPGSQGQGWGSELVVSGLDRADQDMIGTYLETSNGANLGFYRNRGFAEVGTITIPTGPPVWRLWRQPRGPDPSPRAAPD